MITIKSEREIKIMRESGRMLAHILEYIKKYIKPGISTYELDLLVEKETFAIGAKPAYKGYQGFPATICLSVNEEVVHGIPKKNKILKSGDIISCDGGILFDGYYSDACRTYGVGEISEEAQKLIDATKNSFYEGFNACKVGNRVSDIGNAVQTYAENLGYSVIRDYVGHGIGMNIHEDPQIPNYGKKGKGPLLRAGMVICVEPMLSIGSYEVETLLDGWTAVTVDNSLSAHYENTIAITEEGPVILTEL